MPIINVHLVEGRSDEQKKRLIAGLTQATIDALEVSPEKVVVLLEEVLPSHWAKGGVRIADSISGSKTQGPEAQMRNTSERQ